MSGAKKIRRLSFAAFFLGCWSAYAAASATAIATVPAPIKIAVFPFELDDFSAANQAGSAPAEAKYLAQATEEAKQLLLQSGKYSLVGTTASDSRIMNKKDLRHCRGCEANIAKTLGADESLLGVVTKISMTEYVVHLQLRDARKGSVISNLTTGLRMGADYSWPLGVRWLMQNRMLASKKKSAR